MIRRYRVLDLDRMEPSDRVVELDLDDPALTSVVVFAEDLGRSVGPARSIDLGRGIEADHLAAVDAGVFPDGEGHRRRSDFPVPAGSKVEAHVWGAERDWRAGYTQVGPPTAPPTRRRIAA